MLHMQIIKNSVCPAKKQKYDQQINEKSTFVSSVIYFMVLLFSVCIYIDFSVH